MTPGILARIQMFDWIKSKPDRLKPVLLKAPPVTIRQSLFSLHSSNARAYRGKFFLDALVAAVNVIDAVHDGFAFRDQRG
jgi:hypothetical protein